MLSIWFYVEDELLLAIYHKSFEQQLEKDFMELVSKEITKEISILQNI